MDTQLKSKTAIGSAAPNAASLDVTKLTVVKKKKKPLARTPRAAKKMREDVKGLSAYVPQELLDRPSEQTAIPAIAKDKKLLLEIEEMVRRIPTSHKLFNCDCRSF